MTATPAPGHLAGHHGKPPDRPLFGVSLQLVDYIVDVDVDEA